MAKKANKPVGRDTAPGLQQQISVENVNDPAAGAWVGTKAEYLSNKETLKSMGYVLPEDDEVEGEGEPEG